MAEPKAPKMVIDVAEPEPEVTEVLPVIEELSASEEAVEPVEEEHSVSEAVAGEAAPTDEATEEPEEEAQGEAEDQDSSMASKPIPMPPAESALEATRAAGNWVTRTFPGHECTFCGAMTGLSLSILVFTIGPWRTLLVATLTGVGALFGQYLDGDMRFVQAVRRLFGGGKK